MNIEYFICELHGNKKIMTDLEKENGCGHEYVRMRISREGIVKRSRN
jgi:hypothetical protein